MVGANLHIWERGWTLMVSYGWVLVITGLLAMAPWTSLAPRFSLRTLLIVMTLVAVGLGVIVFANRAPTSPPVNVGDFDTGEN